MGAAQPIPWVNDTSDLRLCSMNPSHLFQSRKLCTAEAMFSVAVGGTRSLLEGKVLSAMKDFCISLAKT